MAVMIDAFDPLTRYGWIETTDYVLAYSRATGYAIIKTGIAPQ
jgi:hypothetical protein